MSAAGFADWAAENYPIGPGWNTATDLLLRRAWMDSADAQGMTLRDRFAAKALGGMLADIPNSCYGLDWQEKVATAAYELADAMLKARTAC